MYLHRPGMKPGQKTLHQDQILAVRFWASAWGLLAIERLDTEALPYVVDFLTASPERGGMEASWDICDGFPGLLLEVEEERPFRLITERK